MNRRQFVTAAATVSLATLLPHQSSALNNTVSLSQRHPLPHLWSNNSITATWIGQSTIVMNIYGVIVITDPVLFDAVGVRLFGTTYGHRRLTRSPLAAHEIPKPDIILLSHAHMDHTDRASLEYLSSRYPSEITVLCAKNTRDIIDDLPWATVRELDWWESMSIKGVTISAVEVLHNGARYPWENDRREGNRSGRSYNGYCIEAKGRHLFFAGDTAHTDSINELRSLDIDIAFMPIGAYHGYSSYHCTPEDAVRMALSIRAKIVAPLHCMTFNQSDEPFAEPIQRYESALQQYGMKSGWKLFGEEIVVE